MKCKWEIDATNTVEAKLSGFGTEIVRVNGKEVVNRRRMRTAGQMDFQLPDGRKATIRIIPDVIGRPHLQLQVDDRLMIQTTKESVKCPACGVVVRPNDRFCDGCGAQQPSAEHRTHKQQLNEATRAVRTLAVLFALSGTIMFFVTKSQAADSMVQLASLAPDAMVPIEGVSHSVAELRTTLAWEPWDVLITNLVLAAVMAGLAVWGKRAPLPAVLVATATYVVVNVANAIADPKTIAQGIIVKVVVIALLVKGIKSAIALRTANA